MTGELVEKNKSSKLAARKQKKNAPGKELKSLKSRKGVVYLGHIPHGFYEDEMRGFFGQFGEIVNIRLSRSKKTGRSRGYAFIQFVSDEVAGIVQDAMDKYILAGRHLKCECVPAEKVHERMFFGSNMKFKPVPYRAIAKSQHNKTRTEKAQNERLGRLKKQDSKKRERLASLGIDYDFEGYAPTKKVDEKSSTKKRKATDSNSGTEAQSEEVAETPVVKKQKKSKVSAANDKTPAKSAAKSKTPAKSAAKSKTPAKSAAKSMTPAKSAAKSKTPAKATENKTPAKSTKTKTPAKSAAKSAKSKTPKSSRK